ncbi:hypothetical protein FD723_18570 [Nostoc sp. C052]|uniref:hypothetical protein n=1 Tax=Nostoc sp. C052 TaxID=2576902 RepID=UPI0015C3D6C4|nr:hypothetical protein [Nostoc sp. C052]QLE42225.1 hypothetical protein FD723_18570 [Nostoc sp. C052]
MMYKLMSPEGEIVEFESVAQFCRKQGLNAANIYNVLRGVGKVCHGWRLVDPTKPYCMERKRKNDQIQWTTPNPSPTP